MSRSHGLNLAVTLISPFNPFNPTVQVFPELDPLPPGHRGLLGSLTVTVAQPISNVLLGAVSVVELAEMLVIPQAPVGDTTPAFRGMNPGTSDFPVTWLVMSLVLGGWT